MSKKIILTLTFVVNFLLVADSASAQVIRNHYLESFEKEKKIKFEYVNNFIVVELILNRKLPLNFIIDTGAQHTLITKKEIAQILRLKYKREFRVMGADMKRELIANLVTGVNIKIGEIDKPNNALLVLDEDYFVFEQMTGMNIHGILGANFFRQYVVEIDYLKKQIKLIQRPKFKKPGKKHELFEINLHSGKPYINLTTTINPGGKTDTLKYLLDTGAAVSMLINPASDEKIKLPENLITGNIGNGLGGSLDGFVGRISELKIGKSSFSAVPTYFHQLERDSFLILDDRNGLIGNLILERFNVIIDFPGEKLYLRPNKNFKKEFKVDKSGISLLSAGKNFNQIVVQNVLKGSPADLVGVKKGDKVLSINYLSAWFLNLDGILNRLKKKEGKKIRLRLKGEEGTERVVIFYLKNLI